MLYLGQKPNVIPAFPWWYGATLRTHLCYALTILSSGGARTSHVFLMSKLARTYLAVPAASTPSKRLFSAAGNIVTKKRATLSPENVNALISLNKNWPLLFKLSSALDQHVHVKIETKLDKDQEPAMPDLPSS